MSLKIPENRRRLLNDRPVRGNGKYVLYWMVANRRTRFNFALQHAVDRARELGCPLVVLEALSCDYRWSSGRFHQFVMDGMRDNAKAFGQAGVLYHPYIEPQPKAGRGLVEALGKQAAAVVTDDFPAFGLAHMVDKVGARLPVLAEAIDSNGLMPLSRTDRAFPTAYAFRRFLQKELRPELDAFPASNPLARLNLPTLSRLPGSINKRWPALATTAATAASAGDGDREVLAALPIDHSVGPTESTGGERAARNVLKQFLKRQGRYAEDRNLLDEPITSGLSPYLHFGHLSSHEVCHELFRAEEWSPNQLADDTSGRRQGWWGMSESAEAFLDQIVTWREVGFNMCRCNPHYDRYDSLPDWALKTLQEHLGDEREHVYTLEEFESAATHDDLWNAAQRQLVREGVIHNYLRMLWGKKILHWSESPQDALNIMIELNNKYALDGRDPNSYSGIFWVLGRYDRAWGPERPIFGKVRYMTSDNTKRKLKVAGYLARYGQNGQLGW